MPRVVLTDDLLALRRAADHPCSNLSSPIITPDTPLSSEVTRAVKEHIKKQAAKEKAAATAYGELPKNNFALALTLLCASSGDNQPFNVSRKFLEELYLSILANGHGQGGFLLNDFSEARLPNSCLTFTFATGLDNSWKPPKNCTISITNSAEADDTSIHSWLGVIDRVYLMRCLSRCLNYLGQKTNKVEIEFGIKLFEQGEEYMIYELYDTAYRIFVELIRRYPNFALAYYKAGLCLIAMNMPIGAESATIITQTESNASDKKSNDATKTDDKSSEKQLETFNNFAQATEFFRCAVSLEPFNTALSGNIDMVMRLFVGMPVEEDHRYRNVLRYPKSIADAVIMAKLET